MKSLKKKKKKMMRLLSKPKTVLEFQSLLQTLLECIIVHWPL